MSLLGGTAVGTQGAHGADGWTRGTNGERNISMERGGGGVSDMCTTTTEGNLRG